MNLNPEQKATGKENFQAVIGSEHTRREFLQGTLAAGVVSGAGLGAMYFGYEKSITDPVRIGVIGTGDEGNVLIGAHNPKFTKIVAIADIRPFNIYRAFHGDWSSPNANRVRAGLMNKYDYKTEQEAKDKIKVYDKDYRELLKDKDVEAVKQAGYDDGQILEIVMHVALNTWTNYINEIAQTEIDFPVVRPNGK